MTEDVARLERIASNSEAHSVVVNPDQEGKEFDTESAEYSTDLEYFDFEQIFKDLENWETQLRAVDFAQFDNFEEDGDPGEEGFGPPLPTQQGGPKPC